MNHRNSQLDKLYHFTSGRHVTGCKSQGIKLGSIPVGKGGKVYLKYGYQWITVSPEFKQEWCGGFIME